MLAERSLKAPPATATPQVGRFLTYSFTLVDVVVRTGSEPWDPAVIGQFKHHGSVFPFLSFQSCDKVELRLWKGRITERVAVTQGCYSGLLPGVTTFLLLAFVDEPFVLCSFNVCCRWWKPNLQTHIFTSFFKYFSYTIKKCLIYNRGEQNCFMF